MPGNMAAIVLLLAGSFMLLTWLGVIGISLMELLHIWWPALLVAARIAVFPTSNHRKK